MQFKLIRYGVKRPINDFGTNRQTDTQHDAVHNSSRLQVALGRVTNVQLSDGPSKSTVQRTKYNEIKCSKFLRIFAASTSSRLTPSTCMHSIVIEV